MNKFLCILATRLFVALFVAVLGSSAAYPQEDSLRTADNISVDTANAAVVWDAAATLYSKGMYADAATLYATLIDKHNIANPHLYYNAANAFFKQNEIAQAILYYERALKINPDDEDIRHNLVLAQQFVMDKIDAVPVFFVVRWLDAIPQWMHADAWGYWSIAAFAAALALLLLTKVFVRSRRKFMISAVAVLALSLVLLRISVIAANNAQDKTRAIVMLPVVMVKSSPDQNGADLFILHEGTKVEMLENIGTWSKIRIADGNQGWIAKNGIETI
jgi:tetratricopeptide (TPR) repeat protein